MNTTDISHAFTHNPPGVFPKDALQAAMDQPDEISPTLIEMLQKGADDITGLAGTKDDNSFLYAMFLLAQFEEEKGLQPLIDFFCTEGMTAIMLTGDVVTENLNKLFAGMAQRNHAPLFDLIEDAEKNSFVRAAAIEALLSLAAWGALELGTIEDYFTELLTDKLEKEPSHVWNYLSEAAGRIGTTRLQTPLEKAYTAGLASDTYIPRKDSLELLHRSPEDNLQDLKNDQGLAPITNVIKEMHGWACFTPVEERIAPIKIPKTKQPVSADKVGRNDPCPCGSGRKYKKCCMMA
jgi:hypothetical protein